jgi:hypothetical protein
LWQLPPAILSVEDAVVHAEPIPDVAYLVRRVEMPVKALAGRLDAHAIPSLGGVLDDVYERRRELHAGLAQFDFDENVSDRTDQCADESLIAAAAARRLTSAMLGGRGDGHRRPVGYYPPGSS